MKNEGRNTCSTHPLSDYERLKMVGECWSEEDIEKDLID